MTLLVERIQAAAASGLNQTQAAEQLKVSRQTIWRYSVLNKIAWAAKPTEHTHKSTGRPAYLKGCPECRAYYTARYKQRKEAIHGTEGQKCDPQ